MTARYIVLGPFAACLLMAGSAVAQTVEKTEAGVTWQAGVNGVKIDFDNAQHVRRIYSKYAQPVVIADRRGIQTATLIAEEKAKANIIRFLRQDVVSGRAVTEVDATLSQTTQKAGAGGESISTSDQRNIVQGLTEFTGSLSSGTLNGVVVLESGYDPKAKEAWVVAGISDKTIAAAHAAVDMMAAPPTLSPARRRKRRPANRNPRTCQPKSSATGPTSERYDAPT